MKIRLLDLFLIFLRIGGFTFGGGYAMLPLIEKELVEERKLLTDQEFLDIIAVIQGIPGIIAVNSSLFIGYRLRGVVGALTAAAGISLPSVVIIASITKTLLTIQNNPQVISVFTGIRACVVVLIFWAGIRMGKKSIETPTSLLYALGMIIGMLIFNIHPIFLIILSGLIGILFYGKETRLKDNASN